jgi:dihydrofolate reductase
MRKVIVLSFLTLDGVLQAPGAPQEDPSGGFKYGGWMVPYADEVTGQVMDEQTAHPFDLLLGRKTYDIWAAYWPHQDEQAISFAAKANKATKYVASHSPLTPEWSNSVLLEGDVAEEVRKLKAQDGPELQVYGSGDFAQTLFQHDLVDALWLKIFPLTLGDGKRLFSGGSIPAAFRLTASKVSPSGVIIANYERAGEVQTGSFQ